MEAGLAALKARSKKDDPLATPIVEHSGTLVTYENGNMVVSGIPPVPGSLRKSAEDDRHYFSDSDTVAPSTSVAAVTARRRHHTVATQAQASSASLSMTTSEQSLKPLAVMTGASPHEPSGRLLTTKPKPPPLPLSHAVTAARRRTSPDDRCQFDMEMSDTEEQQVMSPHPEISDHTDFDLLSRCISMPVIHQSEMYDDDRVDSWASKQFAATAGILLPYTGDNHTPTLRYISFYLPPVWSLYSLMM